MSVKRWILWVLAGLLLFAVSGYSGNAGAEVVHTYAQTPAGRSGEAGGIVMKTYYELSDGTWEADGHTYQYKLVLTGRLHNAVQDITYTFLSNLEEITFEQAWKASGLGSSRADYFDAEDAVLVAIQ